MIGAIIGVVVGLVLPLGFVAAAETAARSRPGADRRSLVEGFASALVGLLIAWLWVPWLSFPRLLWAAPVAITVYGALRAAPAWRRLPWVAGPYAAVKVAGTVMTVLVLAMVGALLLVP